MSLTSDESHAESSNSIALAPTRKLTPRRKGGLDWLRAVSAVLVVAGLAGAMFALHRIKPYIPATTAHPTATAVPAATITLATSDFLEPTDIEIAVGQSVLFTDLPTGKMHLLVSGMNGQFQTEPGIPAFFDTPTGAMFSPGDKHTVIFATVGTYSITCLIHPAMRLTIHVVATIPYTIACAQVTLQNTLLCQPGASPSNIPPTPKVLYLIYCVAAGTPPGAVAVDYHLPVAGEKDTAAFTRNVQPGCHQSRLTATHMATLAPGHYAAEIYWNADPQAQMSQTLPPSASQGWALAQVLSFALQ